METLKKTTYLIILVIITLLPAGKIKAQDYAALQQAFSTSYTLETAGDYTNGIAALKKVYDETSYELNVRLGWLNYMAGLFSEATTYYARAAALMPYSIEARLGYVLPASAMGNWDQVVNHYLEILKIDPANYTANYRLGLIYYGRKDYATGIKYFEKIANMYPFDYDANHMYAWSNYQLGKLREAKVLFNKTLLIRPNDSSALEGFGLIK
jgi:tetratricopeptide (TPR) repeat protein